MDINHALKSGFKNFDYPIYASENRPVNEILSSVKDKNCWQWEKNPYFMVCGAKLSNEQVRSADLKEYSFRFMKFDDNNVRIDLPELFDLHTFDLKEALDKKGLTEREVHTYFKDFRTLEDINRSVNEVIKDLE